MPESLINRFMSKVNSADDCWVWTGAISDRGYGVIWDGDGKNVGAHRSSWMLFMGEIPKGLCVCHHCDNRACVKPSHLFLGTNADNSRDMVEKGRTSRNSKLTESDVRFVRHWLSKGYYQKHIAKAFGVTQPTISAISTGFTWTGKETVRQAYSDRRGRRR